MLTLKVWRDRFGSIWQVDGTTFLIVVSNVDPIFKTPKTTTILLTVMGSMPSRFGVRFHALPSLSNQYHLLVETPAANLSQADNGWMFPIASVSIKISARRAPVPGPFKAFIVEPAGPHLETSRYIHLNPLDAAASVALMADRRSRLRRTRADMVRSV